MKCANCLHWDRDYRWGQDKDKAACKHDAPSIKPGGMACETTGTWPTTTAEDWCSKFARVER